MPPPTIAELLNFYRDHPLPTEVDETYADYTVEGLPACGGDDSPAYRLLGYPEDPDNVLFLPPDEVPSSSPLPNPDDTLLRRVLSGTGGMVYQREGHNASGDTVPMGSGVLHLCRSESPIGDSGRYTVSVSENAVINNAPGNPAPLRRVPIALTQPEIEALVHGLIRPNGTLFTLPSDHYLVDPTNHSQMSLMPDRAEINDMIALIEADASPIPAERRAPIVAALEQMMDAEMLQVDTMRASTEMQERMMDSQWWTLGIMVAMQLPILYVTMKQMGMTQGLDTFLSNARRMPTMLWNRDWSEWRRLTAERNTARYVPTLSNVGTNLTALNAAGELRAVADATTPRMAELIENRIFARSGAGSAIFEAPPGWGKEILMRELARRNPGTIFIQLTPDQLMAGTMYRGSLEQRLRDIPSEIEAAMRRGQRVVLAVDEFHEAAVAGRSMEETRTLLERWKGPLARGDMRIVGFSTPHEMLKVRFVAGMYDNPADRAALEPWQRELVDQFEREGIRRNIELRALLNRFKVIEAEPRPASDIVTILRDAIEYRRSIGMMNIEMTDEAVRAIARYAESPRGHEGSIPRDAFRLFEGVIEDQARDADAGEPIRVDAEILNDYLLRHERGLAVRFGLAEGAMPIPAATTTVVAPPPPAATETVESAVVRGADARPVDGVSADVVRAQLLERFPRFLSQAAREALEDGRPLPTGPDLVNAAFTREVEALTNRIVAEYHTRMDADRSDIDRRWEDQVREAGYVVREGVPDSFLREVARDYIAREASRASSPFSTSAARFRADADRTLDAAEFERHMELLRHIGR